MPRYGRTLEVMEILRDLLDGRPVDHDGARLPAAGGPAPARHGVRACPPLYFGGLSEPARDVAAREADVYLMWPDTEDEVAALLDDMRARAATHGRTLRFGYRVHVVVRPTEEEARAAARHLLERARRRRGRRPSGAAPWTPGRPGWPARPPCVPGPTTTATSSRSCGRASAGPARGAGPPSSGDPDQVAAKLQRYVDLGMDAFVLSGYPHLDECRRFGRSVLPLLDHAPLVV